MAAVTSCENPLFLETVRTRKFIKDLTGVRGGFLFFLSSHCSTQILTLILILVVINRSWADRHKDTSFLQNMLCHPFAHPLFCLWQLIRFGSVLWNNFRNEHDTSGACPAKGKWLSVVKTYTDIYCENRTSQRKIRRLSFPRPRRFSHYFLLHNLFYLFEPELTWTPSTSFSAPD